MSFSKLYQRPIVQQGLLPAQKIRQVFINTPALYKIHQVQAPAMRAQLDAGGTPFSVMKLAELTDQYCRYASGYLEAMEGLRAERANAQFRNFLQSQTATGMSLQELLAQPLAYITRLHVILNKLVLVVSPSDPEYQPLEAAVDTFNVIIGTMDGVCTPLVRCRERISYLNQNLNELSRAGIDTTEFRSTMKNIQTAIVRMLAQNPPAVNQNAPSIELFHSTANEIETLLYQLLNGSPLTATLRRQLEEKHSSLHSQFQAGFDLGRPGPTQAMRRSAPSVRQSTVGGPSRESSVRGDSSLIDDEEGQLMWTELFGKSTFQVPWEDFFNGFESYLNIKLNQNEKKLLAFVIDNSSVGQVNVYKFAEFLKGFGPLTTSLLNVKSVLGSRWFYGFLTHSEAIRLLETEPVGTYLVRFSQSKPGSFALEATILDAENRPFVLPIQVNSIAGGGFSIHESESGDREFSSLQELISYYTAYLLQPLDSTIPFEVWFHGEISSAEASELLQHGRAADGTFLLRFSSRSGCYASSFVENGAVRHALILSVEGGYCVEGDTHVYASVPELVVGFSAGLQIPLVNEINKQKQEIFRIAESELQRQVEAIDKDDEIYGNNKQQIQNSDFQSSYEDPAGLGQYGTQAIEKIEQPKRRPPPQLERTVSERKTPNNLSEDTVVMMPDGKNIKGGTLLGLVNALLENTASKYASSFLLTYQSFTNPPELLTVLTQKYRSYINQQDGMQAKKARLRICNFVKTWAQKHYSHFDGDYEFISAYQSFAGGEVRNTDGDNLANQLLKTMDRQIARAQSGSNDDGGASFIFSKKPPKPDLPKKFDSGEWTWSDISALEIARQMTLIEEELFRAITPRELIGLAWTKKDKQKRAPNLLKMIDRFNKVSEWVKSVIVQERDLKKRIKIYEKFLQICVCLGELNNYNSAMEITAALESSSIYRLKKTKAKISAKLQKQYEEIHGRLSRAQSYKALREAIHSSNPPVIPYFGMYQSDLTFIEEGNPDFLPNTDPPLINMHKRRLIAQVINEEISGYQQAPYNLQKVPSIRKELEKVLTQNIVSDDDSYKLSLEIEPREPS